MLKVLTGFRRIGGGTGGEKDFQETGSERDKMLEEGRGGGAVGKSWGERGSRDEDADQGGGRRKKGGSHCGAESTGGRIDHGRAGTEGSNESGVEGGSCEKAYGGRRGVGGDVAGTVQRGQGRVIWTGQGWSARAPRSAGMRPPQRYTATTGSARVWK